MAEIRIEATFEGLQDVKDAVNRIASALEPDSLTESVGDGAAVFVETMRTAAPMKTGRLRDSIDKYLVGESAYVITGNTVYNNIQNQGGTNHPQNGPYMWLPADGQFARATTSVTIPATHYVERAFLEGIAPATEAVSESIARKIEG